MRIFLSYASEDRALADQIQLALAGGGYEVFFDRKDLPPAGDYHTRIRAAVEDSDILVFLISPDSLAPGSYALTELTYAREKWSHPRGHVLPVLVRNVAWESVPGYLKAVTALEPEGNIPAEVLKAVSELPQSPGSARWRKYFRLGLPVLLGMGILIVLLARRLYTPTPEISTPPAPIPAGVGETPGAAVSISPGPVESVDVVSPDQLELTWSCLSDPQPGWVYKDDYPYDFFESSLVVRNAAHLQLVNPQFDVLSTGHGVLTVLGDIHTKIIFEPVFPFPAAAEAEIVSLPGVKGVSSHVRITAEKIRGPGSLRMKLYHPLRPTWIRVDVQADQLEEIFSFACTSCTEEGVRCELSGALGSAS